MFGMNSGSILIIKNDHLRCWDIISNATTRTMLSASAAPLIPSFPPLMRPDESRVRVTIVAFTTEFINLGHFLVREVDRGRFDILIQPPTLACCGDRKGAFLECLSKKDHAAILGAVFSGYP